MQRHQFRQRRHAVAVEDQPPQGERTRAFDAIDRPHLAVRGEELLELTSQRCAGNGHDPRQRGKRREGRDSTRQHRMVGSHHEDDRLHVEPHLLDPRIGGRQPAHREIDVAEQELGLQGIRRGLSDHDRDAGMRGLEPRDREREQHIRSGQMGADRDRPGIRRREIAERAPCLADLRDDTARMLDERLAVDRRHGSLRRALEERYAEDGLEVLQSTGDHRLGDVELLRGTGEAPRVGDRGRQDQMAQLEAAVEEALGRDDSDHSPRLCPCGHAPCRYRQLPCMARSTRMGP